MEFVQSIYMNNAATSWPKAPGVADSVYKALNRIPFSPGRTVSKATDAVLECRSLFAELIGSTSPEEIVITQHATHALNLAIFGLNLQDGDVVVTSVMEHNSVLRPLNHIKKIKNIEIIYIGLNDNNELNFSEYLTALKKNPKLVALNHVSNVTGIINDINIFFNKAKKCGAVTLLDVSQSAGHIALSVDKLNADIIVGTGHKGLRGPQGIGFLYVDPAIELKQVIVGGTGIRSDLILHPKKMPIRLESGTFNVPAICGMTTALKWYKSEGNEYHDRYISIAKKLRSELKNIHGIKIFDNEENNHIGIISLQMNSCEVEDLGYILSQSFNIISRSGLHCAPLMHKALGSAPQGTVRLSVSGSTTVKDIDRTVESFEILSKSLKS